MGALEADRLAACLSAQQRDGGRLGQLLVRMQVLPENTVLEALSAQLELPVAPLDQVEIPGEVLSILSRTACEQHGVLPFAMQGPFVHAAMIDPSHRDVAQALRQITRKVVRPYLTGPEALERALRRHFDDGDPLVVDLTLARDAFIAERRPSRPPRVEAIAMEGPLLPQVVAEGPGGAPFEPAEAQAEGAGQALPPTEPPPPAPLARPTVSPPAPLGFEGPDFDTAPVSTRLGSPLPSPSIYDAATELADCPFSSPTAVGIAVLGPAPDDRQTVARLQALEQRVVMLTAELAELHTRVMELERKAR